MKKLLYLVAAIILTTLTTVPKTQADMAIDFGLGALNTQGNPLSQMKFFKISKENEIWYPINHRFSLGLWEDRRGNGTSSSVFTAYQLGFEVHNNLLEMGIYGGPSLISAPDKELGGHLHFNTTAVIGIRDKYGYFIGASYNHFSNAGLMEPNIGKDFISLEIKFPL